MIGARNARPSPVTRRHPDDAGDRRGGKAARHSRAREPQRAAVDLTRAFSTRGQVVHRSLLNRRHDQHVRENAPVERERASGSGRREPPRTHPPPCKYTTAGRFVLRVPGGRTIWMDTSPVGILWLSISASSFSIGAA